MRKKSEGSLKSVIFRNISIQTALILVIFSLLLAGNSYISETDSIRNYLEQRNLALRYLTRGYFAKIYNAVDTLSRNRLVINDPMDSPETQEAVLDLYKTLTLVDHDINYVFSGYKNGTMLINDYETPEGFNSVLRPWYQEALKASPDITQGVPYQEFKTKEWLVSVSKTLINEKGEITGVVSVDSSIDDIAKILVEPKYHSSYSYLLKADGSILVHPDEDYIGKNISEILGFSPDIESGSGGLQYSLNGAKKICYYNRIERLGWIVVTVIDRKEITNPILLKMFINIFVVGLIAVFLGWYLSVSLGRQLIVPLEELHKRVSLIASGETESASSHHYPDNEIGAIATNIEQLTEHELFRRNRELQLVNRKLERLSTTDQLTGLYNRRKIQNDLEKEWDRSKRYNTVFSIIMYDIDWFKKINDTYGHQAGDEVLRSIADLTRSNFRSTDIISRWGGEEFMILCPETYAGDACRMAWKFCSSVKAHDFPGGISVSISAGVCSFSPENNLDFIIRTADERLYQAKQSGRDRVVPASCENPAADKSGST